MLGPSDLLTVASVESHVIDESRDLPVFGGSRFKTPSEIPVSKAAIMLPKSSQ